MLESMLSVIIPLYNMESYIARCLDSVLAQTVQGLEVIVVDDASTDGSLSIVEHYREQHPDVRIVRHTANQGLMVTRRDGYRQATGRFILFVDADDALPPDAAERLMRQQRLTGADIVMGDLLKLYVSGRTERRLGSLPHTAEAETVLAALMEGNIIHSLCGKLFRTELLRKHELQAPDHLTIAEDACLLYQLVARAGKVASVDGFVYRYYENTASSSLRPYGVPQAESVIMAFRIVARTVWPFEALRPLLQRRITRAIFELYMERIPVSQVRQLLRKHDLLPYGSLGYACRHLTAADGWFLLKRFVYVRMKKGK